MKIQPVSLVIFQHILLWLEYPETDLHIQRGSLISIMIRLFRNLQKGKRMVSFPE